MSPSPRRIPDLKKKQHSLDSCTAAPISVAPNNNPIVPITTQLDALNLVNDSSKIENGDGKFENISDNGSEISDEGYRSLGLIQANNQNNNQAKRSSLHSQASTEDAELNGKLKNFLNYRSNF